MVNGFDDLSVTNLDGLDGVEQIKLCVAYRLRGKRIETMPSSHLDLLECQPVYEVFAGWKKIPVNVRPGRRFRSRQGNILRPSAK